MSTTTNLTSHLVALSTHRPYTAATEHEFLASAGNGTLSDARLSFYLSQDRLYAAHGYPRFVGLLLSSIPYSSLHSITSPQERYNQRVLKVLSYSLQNVVREVNFFVDTARTHALELEGWRERKATRDYTAEMIRVAAGGRLQDGLVFLWAMERVYLDAWKFAGSQATKTSQKPSTAVASLIDNWTNGEFEVFVKDLEDLVNDLNIQPGSDDWLRAEEIWSRVVELEEAFWPTEDEIAVMRL